MTTQTVSAVITALQAQVATLSGIKAAPAAAPENLNVFPFAICFPRAGNGELQSASFADYFHTLIVQIHCTRELLERAIVTAMPYIESFPKLLLADPTIAGTVSEVRGWRYQFGGMKYGETSTLGVSFEVDVKLHLEAP